MRTIQRVTSWERPICPSEMAKQPSGLIGAPQITTQKFQRIRHTLLTSVFVVILAFLMVAGSAHQVLAALNPGDLAVVAVNSDATAGDSSFVLVALTNIPAGEVVKITDRSWNGTAFNSNANLEGTITWTAPATNAGALIYFTIVSTSPAVFSVSNGSLGSSEWLNVTTPLKANEGDSLLVYQGTDVSPAFIYAFTNAKSSINRDAATGFYTTADTTYKSFLPASLTYGTHAVSLSGPDHLDNLYYQGPTSGTRASLLAEIGDRTNWTGVGGLNDAPYDFSTSPEPPWGGDPSFPMTPPNNVPTTGTVTANNVTQANAGQTSYTFTVVYTDSDDGLDVSTIDTGDVSVDNGATVSGASVDISTDGSPRTATYTVTPPGGAWDDSDNGTYTIALVGSQVCDLNDTPACAAANASLATFTVSMDLTAPAAPSTPDMTAGTDSGSSDSDNITNDTTPTFSGTAEADAAVELFYGGSNSLGTTSADGNGNWSMTATEIPEGSQSITAKATDAAGNTGTASAPLSVTIDTTAPAAPSTPDMSAGTDSGNSDSDDITNDTTPTFSGTAAANAAVELFCGGSNSLGTTGADESGNWSMTATEIPEGIRSITAKATDTAGNTGVASSALSVTIDTTPPSVTITQAAGQNDPTTENSTVTFKAAFSEAVVGFAGSDITIGGSAGAAAATVTETAPNDGTAYNIAVTGMTRNGTVTVTIPADQAADNAGNGNLTSTNTDNSVTIALGLVLNEFDYDQGAIDNAEFIEIKNVSGGSVDLSSYAVKLIDNAGAAYQTITLSGTLNDGGYHVICGDNTNVPNCDTDVTPNTDLIRDGAPNAIALVKGTFVADTVSYEGDTPEGYTETGGIAGPADDGAESFVGLSRTDDGADTDHNSTDFGLRCVTPGGANNLVDNSSCFQISIDDPTVIEGDSGTTTLDFTVSLSHPATADVTADYATTDNTATLAGNDYASKTGTVTFPAGSNANQTVSITVNGDNIDEGVSESLFLNVSGISVNAQINDSQGSGTITDDDSAGVTITETNESTSVNESGTTDTFTVVLDSQPESNVELSVISANTAEATVSAIPPLPLLFTPADWNVPQTVTVTGVDDAISDGDQTVNVTISVVDANSDNKYDPLGNEVVTVTVVDNDIPGVGVIPTSLTVSEPAGSKTFTLTLNTPPTDSVTVPLQASTACTLSTDSVTIASGDWNTGATVTVTAVDDAIDNAPDRTCTVTTGDPTSNDSDYNSLNAGNVDDVSVTVTDDDTAGATVNPTTGLTISEPDGTATFTVTLDTEPADPVTVGLRTPSGECSAVASGGTLTAANYTTGVTVTVTATDDNVDDGNRSCLVETSFTGDAVYTAIDPDDVTVTVQDNDTAGITVGTASNATEGGAAGSYSVTLDTEPTAGDVTISVTPADTAQCTVNPASLTLNSGMMSGTVSVTAVNDTAVEGNHSCVITHAVTGGPAEYPVSMSVDDATVSLIDNNPGVIIRLTDETTQVAEGGATDTFDVLLSTDATVSVTLTPDGQSDLGSGSGTDHTLNFTAGNTPQTVTVTAVDDLEPEGPHSSTVTLTSTSGTGTYNPAVFVVDGANDTPVTSLSVTVDDNDTASITVAPTTLTVSEPAGSDAFTITLEVQPGGNADVSIPISTSDPTICTASPNPAVIANAAWNTGVVVTVTATNDNLDNPGDQRSCTVLTGAPRSASPLYNTMTASDVDDVTVIVSDDDAPEIEIIDLSSGTEILNSRAYVAAHHMGAGSILLLEYRITNKGNWSLNLTTPVQISGPHAANLTVLQQPSAAVAPGEATDMVLMFSSISDDTQDATVTIPNNDSDESPFSFTLVINPHYLLWTK